LQPLLYSSLASQWANVPKLGLVEKGFKKGEVEIKEIDLSILILPPWKKSD
jgi:hypothetical protein